MEKVLLFIQGEGTYHEGSGTLRVSADDLLNLLSLN